MEIRINPRYEDMCKSIFSLFYFLSMLYAYKFCTCTLHAMFVAFFTWFRSRMVINVNESTDYSIASSKNGYNYQIIMYIN